MHLVLENKGKLGREEKLLDTWAKENGVPVTYAVEKWLRRRKVVLAQDMVPIGSVVFVQAALRQFSQELPPHAPYPVSLTAYLHRYVKQLYSLRELQKSLDNGYRWFVKPVEGWKRFTGFVAEDRYDPRFNGVSIHTPVWISEPVEFLSEWRVYVVNGQVLDVRFAEHGGDRSVVPNMTTIRQAVHVLHIAEPQPAGFVIDFGVLRSGETALVEMNDGFSFGAYDGVSAESYLAVTAARWRQLISLPIPAATDPLHLTLYMPRCGEDGVIVVTRSDGVQVEFRGKPYSTWEGGEDSPMYQLHASLKTVNIAALHCSEVETLTCWNEEWPVIKQLFETALKAH